MPSFRPFSFLSNLAERVMPSEPWPPTPTNGTEDGRDGSAQPPTAHTSSSPTETPSPIEPPAVLDAPEVPAPEPVDEPVTEARHG